MKVYTELMEHNDVPSRHWMLYADIECQKCGKNQSLVDYRINHSECVKCGSKINV